MIAYGCEIRTTTGLKERLAMVFGALCAMMAPAAAQDGSITWSDIACGESRLAVADKFRCRASNPYAPGGGSSATYRFYTATSASDGTTYLYLMEGLDRRSWVRLSRPLPEQLSQSIPLAQSGSNWSAIRLHAGSGYALFTAQAGEACVGFRKAGPDRGSGHAWAILGIHCAPKGRTLGDSQVVAVIESARTK